MATLSLPLHNYHKGVEDRLPSELSGGMKKRVALARSIIFDVDHVHVHVSAMVSNSPPATNFHNIVRNSRSRGYYMLMKAKVSSETDVLAQDSVGVAGIGDPQEYGIVGMHHVGILCKNLERSLDFYQNVLGLEINEARPDNKLPYRGAWLWVGSEMIHLMELPNPDPLSGRPDHGGRDRHTCVAIKDVSKLKPILDKAGIPYTLSRSGRPAIFFRDPDENALEFAQFDD